MSRRRRARQLNSSSEPWTPAEELRLRELAGHYQRDDIARRLSKEFGVPRTRAAVCVRARLLGISLWWNGYSQNEVAAIFGVCTRTVGRWRTDDLIEATPWEIGRGRFGEWHFTEVAIARFINRQQWAYGLETMPPGKWRTRAEVAHRAEPWLTVRELVQLWGCNERTIRGWADAGRIPHRRRHAGVGQPKIVVRAADLPGLRAELREQALANMRESFRLRTERRRQKAA